MCIKFKFVVAEYCYQSLRLDLTAVAHEKAQAEVRKQGMFSLEMRLVHSALGVLRHQMSRERMNGDTFSKSLRLAKWKAKFTQSKLPVA